MSLHAPGISNSKAGPDLTYYDCYIMPTGLGLIHLYRLCCLMIARLTSYMDATAATGRTNTTERTPTLCLVECILMENCS